MTSLVVKISNVKLFGDGSIFLEFMPEFEVEKKNKPTDDFLSIESLVSLSKEFNSTFMFSLYKFEPVEFQFRKDNDKLTKLWQQFISENLGEKFYKKLVAADMKQSLDLDMKKADEEYVNLVKRFSDSKKYQAELKARKAQFEADYGDVLDENGEVLPIVDDDTKKV